MSHYVDSQNSPPQCPTCGSIRTIRVQRKGLLQTMILHRFGIFPWECKGCKKAFTFKNRGNVKRRHRANHNGVVKLPPSLNGTPSQQFDF